MLNTQKDIASAALPLLMQSANGDWKLVIRVSLSEKKSDFHIVEKIQEVLDTRVISQTSPVFYVGAEVWELDYGATLMTLQHASLADHPANELWQQWNSSDAKKALG